jgi:hypothetical protein
MESAAVPVEAGGVAPGEKGLKSGALDYLSNTFRAFRRS